MFERYLSDVLTSYFGSMIENLDANQVRLSAWKGELVLQDLSIRSNALDRLVGSDNDCPVEIAYGTIGNLELRIPLTSVWRWSSAESSATSAVECSVILDNVNILVTPKTRRKRRRNQDDEDVSLEERRMQKEHDVQRLLDAQLFDRITKPSSTTAQPSKWQWARNLIKNALANLSVTVRNIHVRYEDGGLGFLRTTGTIHREAFCVGMTLHQFSVQTTDSTIDRSEEESKDSNRDESEHKRSYSVRHKLAAAYRLAIYWDRGRGCHLMTANVCNMNDDILQVDSMDSMQSEAKLVEHQYFEQAFQVLNGEFRDDFSHVHLYNVQHTYLLSPVSPSMEFTLVTEIPRKETEDAEMHPLIPPSTVNMTFPPCHFTISANTLEDTAYLRKSLAVWSRTRKSSMSEASVRRLTGLRPSTSPLEDPRGWWKYAVEATLVLERRVSRQNEHWRPHGWLGVARAIQRRHEYVRLYKIMLSSEEEVDRENAHCELVQLEDDLLLEEIVAFRLSVYYLVPNPTSFQKPGTRGATSGLTWTEWVRGKGKEEPADVGRADSESEKVPLEDLGTSQLSVDHRWRMYLEMTDMLERAESSQMFESSFQRSDGSSLSVTDLGVEPNPNPNVVVWKTRMEVKELSIQINERVAERSTGYELRPAVKLSCALLQRQTLYRSDAWEVDSAIASLQVVDLTKGLLSSSEQLFPVLLGRKLESISINDGESNDSVEIDGTMHPLSASVSVKRTIQYDSNNTEKNMNREVMPTMTIHSVIRLMPLEVVYSTNPVAALTRALSTMKTPELTDDYNRVMSVVARWRNRQKGRLLRALAHKRKKIVVDVDIAAPVVLIPENPNQDESPLLVIDLGRLRFSNADVRIESGSDYDDKWKLVLDEIQVQCSSTALYRMNLDKKSTASSDLVAGSRRTQKLVEPFSLHFIVCTRITNEETDSVATDGTFVSISATLPRLVFNLTSSAVRLVERLKLQWVQRAQKSMDSDGVPTGREPTSGYDARLVRSPTHKTHSVLKQSEEIGSTSLRRRIKFSFSAPLVGFRLENDVDGRGCLSELSDDKELTCTSIAGAGGPSCPLVHIVLQGIQGELVQAVESNANSTSTFDARLRSITAVDLYQRAGEDFALLLSSLPPSTVSVQLSNILEDRALESERADIETEDDDLVSVQYVSSCSTPRKLGHSIPNEVLLKNTLAITFYELYVEWNPETIAAIHKGMMLPKDNVGINQSEVRHHETTDQSLGKDGVKEVLGAESDDDFYDAIEAVDASDSSLTSSKEDDEESGVHLLSEVSSRVSCYSDVTELSPQIGLNVGGVTNPSSPFLYSGEARPVSGGSINPLISSLAPPMLVGNDASEQKTGRGGAAVTTMKSLEVTFKLSALRVNFNKDSRHRRVVTAEMDDTDVLYLLQQSGKSRTKARIGNLSFTDPSSAANTTLYKEILGLKADSTGVSSRKAASLLEMDLSLNPRKRHLVASDEDFDEMNGVAIDTCNGTVHGSDITVSLHLSPMRFVYLQQFWMEIIDYFFEGIVGYEVWGKKRPLFDPESSVAVCSNGHQHETSRCHASSLKSNLPGILAEEFSITRFDVRMDDPMILIPVSYSSPHHLRLEFASLTAANYYLGRIIDVTDAMRDDVSLARERVQWYNNCIVQLHDLKLTSWKGSVISCSGAGSGSASSEQEVTDARIRVNWPAGRWALSVIPKWKVDCDVDCMALRLRREDYALLQHIIVHNIGEVSRHIDEWNALQSLPPSQLEAYKKEIMVHFGYDKKDTAPTTYAISVNVPSIKFFCLGSSSAPEEVIMHADCTSVGWQLRKLRDRISRQRVTCDITLTKPADSGGDKGVDAVELLLPVNDSTETFGNLRGQRMDSATDADAITRELSYTSTTQPSGDNVKMLEIVDACIFAVCPAWNNIKQFFSNLPEPDFMSPDEIGLAMQIGDRWYRIGGSGTAEKGTSFLSSGRHVGNEAKGLEKEAISRQVLPSYQFRLLLRSPRIVLPSGSMDMETSCVVLRMDHLDFFHHNDGHSKRITKTFFVHDLELYTSSIALLNRSGYVDERSLISPWCIAGHYDRCDSRIAGPCDEHGIRIKGDVLQATAAYSDMSVAIDVGLRFFSDLEESQSRISSRYPALSANHRENDELSRQSRDFSSLSTPCSVPRKNILAVELDGFELEVVDDSMRHFAGAQQLIKISLLEMSLYQLALEHNDEEATGRRKRTKVSLHRVSIFDCLQPIQSPFRLVATSRQSSTETGIHQTDSEIEGLDMLFPRMSWADFHTIEDGRWGFSVSQVLIESTHGPALSKFCEQDHFGRSRSMDSDKSDEIEQPALDLVELHHLFIHGVSDEYAVNLRSLAMQWNPSTVIALQRFLGRLHKEAKSKSKGKWAISRAPPTPNSDMSSLAGPGGVPTHARFQMERLTIFLNKEHQHRCLVRAALTNSFVTYEHDQRSGITLQGSVKDLSAWDTDTSTARGTDAVLEEHRRILQVVSSDKPSSPCGSKGGVTSRDLEFLRFRFKTFAGSDPTSIPDELPLWVKARLVGSGQSRSGIDDYLSVSVATIRVCYIRERIEEILDYLSNGLPGKGMGATSRAAKGFISKRIQTKSYLELNIQAPQMFVPQHEKSNRGVLVRLGDVNARSWFEEATDGQEAGNNEVLQHAVWYRVLSVSLTGLSWNANENGSSFEIDDCPMDAAPLNVKLEVRKPTKRGNAVVVKGSLSCVEVTLTYTTFMLLNAVMRDNISREINKDRWDNVEKAYWMEEEMADQPAYSSSARFVHYGQERRPKVLKRETHSDPSVRVEEEALSPVPELDCLLNLDGLRLILRRNDPLEGLDTLSPKESTVESAFCYDIVVFRADSIEITLNTNSVGDKSLQVTLCRIGVFDLGDSGRLARARYYQTLAEFDTLNNASVVNPRATRAPCAFSVLVEGYSASEEHTVASDRKGRTAAEPQVLLTIDTCAASSAGLGEDSVSVAEDVSDKIILARVVFNYLSINTLIRPLQEVLAFLTCSWSLRGTNFSSSIGDVVRKVDDKGEKLVDQVVECAKPNSFRKGLQLKVVAHYPRVFFLADESDPCSRALVLRGLAVLDASIVDQETIVDACNLTGGDWRYEMSRGFCDKKVVTAVNAQLHSMETYINPNVETALGLEGHNPDLFDQSVLSVETCRVDVEKSDEQLLGVALIQPVTAGIEFCQIRRHRFPTLESLSVNMEPVSTMLSFEDLTLLEAILERWSQRAVKKNLLSISGSSSHFDSLSTSMEMVSPSPLVSEEVSERGVQIVTYDVTFERHRLGLVLKKVSGAIVVENMQSALEADSVQIGDSLTAIDGVAFESPSLDEVVELLSTSPRPITVSFSRKTTTFPNTYLASASSFEVSRSFSRSQEEPVSDDSVDAVANEGFADDKRMPEVYTVTFRRGVPNGLIVEPSPCGSLPVVIDVLPSFFLNAVPMVDGESCSIEISESLSSRLPRTGAVVVEIDGKPSSEIGYIETKELLLALSSKTTDAEKLSISVDRDPTFSIKFLELDASEWGKIRSADISIAGITLTFIDDFKGRDMPLLRGKLEGIDVHIERGLGIDPRAVDSPPPNVLELSANGVDSRDVITMTRLLIQMEVEYYHPRIAVWEPLLEPANICFLVEWQLGSEQRPGQLAMEVTDSLFDSTEAVLQPPGLAMAPRIVTLNFTDAAAEVVLRSFKEFRDWRHRTTDRQEADMQSLESRKSQTGKSSSNLTNNTKHAGPLSPATHTISSISSNDKIPGSYDTKASIGKERHVAAQKAAKAALVFAQKRGAGTKKESESSKPFVFRNRTGMPLSFTQQGPLQNENGHIESKEQRSRPIRGADPICLESGSEARFHMGVISQEQRLKDEHLTKRVRAYDGQYPSLCVMFDVVPGIIIKPLGNLPVFKVGNTISRLEVRKHPNGAAATLSDKDVDPTDGYTEFSVPVVWTVEIEDNRRILTLSSSVRVISSGVSLSIDVGIRNSTRQGFEKLYQSPVDTMITEVGTAKSGSPFYLPLWLALKCQVVDVFVKPSGIHYGWSKESVLSFIPVQAVDDVTSLSVWSWRENFESSCTVSCDPPSREISGSRTLWLSCISLPHVKSDIKSKDVKQSTKSLSTQDARGSLISIAVDAGLTIRNMLPVNLQWEVGTFESSELVPLDSFLNGEQHEPASHLSDRNDYGLQSGEGVEILSFCLGLPDARARFRCHFDQDWSEWAQLVPSLQQMKSCYPPEDGFEDIGCHGVSRCIESERREMHQTRQLNVQIRDEFGVPLTLGVRIVPKLTEMHNDGNARCFGYDAIVFAECWLRNLTPLPLSFGCPSAQINKSVESDDKSSDHSSDDAGIINAEAALLEIASILEFGERGKGLNLRDDNASISVSSTYLLPYQTADLIVEEVFEYVEVENAVVKRRWWASETHDSIRQDPFVCSAAGNGWHWIDNDWKIDCSGQNLRASDGWESCRSLIGGKEDYFSRRRAFNPSHPFRRRRWLRRRGSNYRSTKKDEELLPGQLYEGINAFHHPVNDSFSRAQKRAREMQKKAERNAENKPSGSNRDTHAFVDEDVTKISIKCSDGQWSSPCIVPQRGVAHGVVRVPASRWPTLTKLSNQQAAEVTQAVVSYSSCEKSSVKDKLTSAGLSPALYELCYNVADLGDDWGELTRMFLLTPRFMLRNDSKATVMEFKQSGAPDATAVAIQPGDVVPFFWADFRLPELVSVRPLTDDHAGNRKYRWSGGFDVCSVGMTSVRLRRSRLSPAPTGREAGQFALKSIRTLVEIRSGTGGTGINVSFREEDPSGNGSLFRIENQSPFRIWIAQDGVLANPSAILEERTPRTHQGAHGGEYSSGYNQFPPERRFLDDYARTDGDMVEPGGRTAFALDVPYRQGKYAGRKAASMEELTRVRVGLAPLSSRDGVESTKVVSLSAIGESVRLSPAKLSSISGFDIRTHLVDLRVLGVVTTDGPTRVLRFCMMRKTGSSGVFDYTLSNIASSSAFRSSSGSGVITSRGKEEYLQQVTLDSTMKAIEMDAPVENDAIRLAFFGGTAGDIHTYQGSPRDPITDPVQDDTIFSFRASFCGFSCSLIDRTPSEIALITLKDVSVSASFNKKRTADGTALISVGWLQVDNYIPSAPFPVAVCPVESKIEERTEDGSGVHFDSQNGESSPLLLVGLTLAPKHKSGILCVKSASIAPRDLAVSIDLAFVVRLQQFFVGIHGHLRNALAKDNMTDQAKSSLLLLRTETRQFIPFPDIESMVQQLEGANAGGVGSQKLYFEGLTILPCNINLSVAPARALTSAQESLEGSEAAALHVAVRKGDLLVGGGMLGVNIGHKNKTAVAVARGVFKSIIVDALLRCEAASLNFSGVYLRNHISTGPQLKTFLGAHYIESLKSNVPALLGSMSALGNPLGLIRGIGDGMSDFVSEPVKGLRKSMEELDPSYVVGGFARGTKSLARHAVGGFAGSASLLTETFSKNMAVITLDRRYAQRRDRRNTLRSPDRDIAVTLFEGVESGAVKLVRGVWDGVTGVVRAPLRGAERHGMEGFAKGVGKGLLGLLVKPMIGLSDAATDVMIGVQGSVEGKKLRGSRHAQVRPRRPMYGPDRILRSYSVADAAAATLMLRTKLAGENYLSHCDMDDQVALFSVKRMLLLGSNGQELLVVKYKNIEKVGIQPLAQRDNGSEEWAVVIVLRLPRSNERPPQAVIKCRSKSVATELCSQLNRGISLAGES